MRYEIFFMVCIQVNHSWSLELFHNKFITKRCSKNFLPVLGEGCSISIIWSSFLSIFLIAWFVSELCPLYWLQTNDLPSVLFVPFVAFAVSNREKAKKEPKSHLSINVCCIEAFFIEQTTIFCNVPWTGILVLHNAESLFFFFF